MIIEDVCEFRFKDTLSDKEEQGFMSYQELLQAAKDIQITSEEITELRNLLEEQGRDENFNSASSSHELLSRTYSL